MQGLYPVQIEGMDRIADCLFVATQSASDAGHTLQTRGS